MKSTFVVVAVAALCLEGQRVRTKCTQAENAILMENVEALAGERDENQETVGVAINTCVCFDNQTRQKIGNIKYDCIRRKKISMFQKDQCLRDNKCQSGYSCK